MFVSLVCLVCTYAEFNRNPAIELRINQTIPTRCFSEKMNEQGIDPYWTNLIQNANLDIRLKYYFEDNRTLGYMNPGEPGNISYLNRKFHDTMDSCRRASVISHEMIHHLGYRHKRDVAYAVNTAFEACCAK